MKKLLTVILTSSMLFSLPAYEQNMATGNGITTKNTLREGQSQNKYMWKLAKGFDFTNETIEGGWDRADSPVITKDVKELVHKAVKNLVGARYIPVAYIGNQVVAGTNHCILCKIAPVTPDSIETYSLVYLYEDLEGNVEITDIIDSDAKTHTSDKAAGEDGGWNETKSPIVTKEAQAAIEKATEGLTGASYTPVAYLANQVVSGTNYCILCEVNVIYPGAEATYSIVHVYKDLEGNAEITDMFDFTPANN